MDELERLLLGVPDTCEDFVAGVKRCLRDDDESLQKVIRFIREDPGRTSSDICEYLGELGW